MLNKQKLFGNYFDDETITSPRLSNFAQDAYNRFRANDPNGQFTELIEQLLSNQTALAAELGDVSGAVAIRKGKTLTVDEMIKNFQTQMSELEGAIAYRLGGHKTPAFLELYPQGITEYRRANKTQMPTLVQRVADMATRNAAALGEEITQKLKAFKTDWTAARNNQEGQKGEVSENRTERGAARVALELILLRLIHAVAGAFPGDVDACNAYFDFSMLDVPRNSSLDEDPTAPQP